MERRQKCCSFVTSLFVSVVLTVCSWSFCLGGELEEIRSMIRAKGHKWIAGETSVSKLSNYERRIRCGHLKPKTSVTPPMVSVEEPVAALAATLDWRSMGGQNFVTPVRNQGNCGSCWAFATTAALESYILIKDGRPAVDDNRAEEILLSCSGAGSCNGGYIGSASEYIRSTGLPPESFFPYTVTSADDVCTNAQGGWTDNVYRTGTWSWVTGTSPVSIDAIKSALANGPVVTTMDVYDDFYSYKSGPYQHTLGNLLGGHAVLIVGYTDDPSVSGGGYFTVKNSWGTGWGSLGYFQIAYSQTGSPVFFGEYTIAYQQGATPPAAPTNLAATALGSSSIGLTWADNSSNESGFKIERCAGSGCTSFSQVATVGSNATSYTSSGLAANTSYTFRVRAYNSGGDSAYSSQASAITLEPPPPPSSPSSLSGSAVSRTQISLSWVDTSTNEDGFRIERCTGATCTNFAQIAALGANTVQYNNTGLRKGTTYRYRVTSYNAGGASTPSNIVNITTKR